MRNLKKFLALVLAMMMTLSLLVVANAAPATPTDFTDLDKVSPAYAEAVNVLSALKIIKGDDGFRPGDTITRAEVSAMLYRIAHNDASESQVKIYKDYDVFPDVQSDKWYAGSVNYCANAGYLKGYPNGSFGPSNEVTGYEVLVMTLRMLGYGKNGEFEGKQGDWRLQAAMYGRKAGLTAQIKEGTLGQPATREMVAEIMFQALQAETVDYNLLKGYYANNVLIADNKDNRDSYKVAIDAGLLTLPLNGNLMYVNYGIVGKTAGTPDPFGRPTEAWVTDLDGDTMVHATGYAGKYIVNATVDGKGVIGGKADNEALRIALTPVATYDNAIDECHLTKDVNNDTSIFWNAITEIVNGEVLNTRAGNGKLDALHTTTKWIGATGRTTEIYKLDEKIGINSTTGAVGTIGDPGIVAVNKWRFVYIDTFLGKVQSTVEEVKDTAGHTIIEPTATVILGWDQSDVANNATNTNKPGNALKVLTISNPGGKFQRGDLVLLQTPYADKATRNETTDPVGAWTPAALFISGNAGPNAVSVPEKAPLYPTDVPNDADMFVDGAAVKAAAGTVNAISATDVTQILVTAPTTVRVTIKATVGAQDAKMGVIGEDGKTYMASNTFLAGRQAPAASGTSYNKTVLKEYYDVPNGDQKNDSDVATVNKGIVNAMIGRTYDLVLDQHGYIVGLKEVLTINEGVGVITSIDAVRVGGGKYVTEVEAYMTDGSTKTFQLLGGELPDGKSATLLDKMTDGKYKYFSSVSDADDAWKAGGLYNKPDTTNTNTVLGLGSLVQFKTLTYDGKTFNKIVDWDQSNGDGTMSNQGTTDATGAIDADALVKTGVHTTLTDDESTAYTAKVDSKSVVFVAEYEYRYNTSGNNDGSNVNKTYKVYEGFKAMPTIKGGVTTAANGSGAADTNVLFQQLGKVSGNEKYVLVYAADTADEYIIKNQDKITVDDSYLVLSRGATYAEYSEYNVLKNGVPTVLQVSNANKALNSLIESTMDATVNDENGDNHLNELLLVTGTNVKGYVTSVSTVTMSKADTTINKNVNGRTDGEIIKAYTVAMVTDPDPANSSKYVSHSNDVLAERDNLTPGTATSGTVKYMTLDDNVKVQLVNRDQKTVTEISLDVAMIYANGSGAMTPKNMVFELNELGYICNLYVIE